MTVHETSKTHPKIFPVIHFLDRNTAISEAEKASDAGADGVFLISHKGEDLDVLDTSVEIQSRFPRLRVGVNLLHHTGVDAVVRSANLRLPMVWGDDLGVDSTGLTDMGLRIQAIKSLRPDAFDVFASVAFKYRPHEPNPALAAKKALQAGFIPTTSGPATGAAPDLEKIVEMSNATGGLLAVASGMTPENVGSYSRFLSHILVATGVAIDEYRIDTNKLKLLIANSRA